MIVETGEVAEEPGNEEEDMRVGNKYTQTWFLELKTSMWKRVHTQH